MQKILCFGDSNTFGFNPLNGSRYKQNERWSGILKQRLQSEYLVIEQGCNNRTAISDNSSIELTGYKVIEKYLKDDFDTIILQIGINDMQFLYNCELNMFSEKFNDFINLIKSKSNAKIVLLCPSVINECILKSSFALMFDQSSIEKSKKLPEIYGAIAKKTECELIDLNFVANVSKIDGLHYDIENHKIIAKKLFESFN